MDLAWAADGVQPKAHGRLDWLREQLEELGRELGRVPTAKELSTFLRKYQVLAGELDDLIDMDWRGPAIRCEAPASPSAQIESREGVSKAPIAQVPSALDSQTVPPEANELLVSEDVEGPPIPQEKVVRRAVDDLVDDWYRTGKVLHYDDVVRLVTKRVLSAEQTSAVVAALVERDVEIEGLTLHTRSDLGSEDLTESGRTERVTSDGARAYLAEISHYPLISAEDEVRLGRQIQAGLRAKILLEDSERLADVTPAQQLALQDARAAGRIAHQELVCANLRLVVSIAKLRSYQGSGVELIDRFQDGNRGLLRAAEKFDPSLGFKFSTYSTWWIRQAISRGIDDRGRLIRLPVHVREQLRKLRRSQRLLVSQLDREPTTVDLADHLGWQAGTVQALLDWSQPTVSLDIPIGDAGGTTLGDLLSEKADIDGRGDPVNCVVESAWSRDLNTALDLVLDPRGKDVIQRRFGLNGSEDDTLENIGRHFGVTRERIRQIEAKALEKLTEHKGVDHLRAYLVDDRADNQLPLRQSNSARNSRHQNDRRSRRSGAGAGTKRSEPGRT